MAHVRRASLAGPPPRMWELARPDAGTRTSIIISFRSLVPLRAEVCSTPAGAQTQPVPVPVPERRAGRQPAWPSEKVWPSQRSTVDIVAQAVGNGMGGPRTSTPNCPRRASDAQCAVGSWVDEEIAIYYGRAPRRRRMCVLVRVREGEGPGAGQRSSVQQPVRTPQCRSARCGGGGWETAGGTAVTTTALNKHDTDVRITSAIPGNAPVVPNTPSSVTPPQPGAPKGAVSCPAAASTSCTARPHSLSLSCLARAARSPCFLGWTPAQRRPWLHVCDADARDGHVAAFRDATLLPCHACHVHPPSWPQAGRAAAGAGCRPGRLGGVTGHGRWGHTAHSTQHTAQDLTGQDRTGHRTAGDHWPQATGTTHLGSTRTLGHAD
ncbi:hypothetical protein CC78DRAFT_603868 [Lojkania enalia]|uniref:Uncharacterized protein n=1 Tax=Lojkania enalia TaxID=147567 RepID=A0A9P4K8Y0_9PLEO|nr:hypothetical protein CC78DRAFT_603868 [Didymosphaeria enalia]